MQAGDVKQAGDVGERCDGSPRRVQRCAPPCLYASSHPSMPRVTDPCLESPIPASSHPSLLRVTHPCFESPIHASSHPSMLRVTNRSAPPPVSRGGRGADLHDAPQEGLPVQLQRRQRLCPYTDTGSVFARRQAQTRAPCGAHLRSVCSRQVLAGLGTRAAESKQVLGGGGCGGGGRGGGEEGGGEQRRDEGRRAEACWSWLRLHRCGAWIHDSQGHSYPVEDGLNGSG